MVTPEQTQILKALLDNLSPADQAALSPLSSRDLSDVVSGLVGDKRATKVKQGLNTISKGTISNWNALQTTANSADSATILSDISDFEAAITAQNGDALFAAALAVGFSVRKLYGR
jgi:hypothetical protein